MAETEQIPREMTVLDAAKFYGRTRRTIYKWCENGLLIKVGCKVFRDMTGHWKIIQPDEN
jgi:hypothetical protein